MINTTLTLSRIFPYSAELMYEKYSHADALARWWGPNGFTNSFESFDFREGGKWIFIMSDEKNNYPNEMVFHVIKKEHIVMEHTVEPYFTIEVIFEKLSESETNMTWISTFKNPEFLSQMRKYLIEKNNENFDRLETELKNYNS